MGSVTAFAVADLQQSSCRAIYIIASVIHQLGQRYFWVLEPSMTYVDVIFTMAWQAQVPLFLYVDVLSTID